MQESVQLKARINRLKKKKLRLKRSLELLTGQGKYYQPSLANAEDLEEYWERWPNEKADHYRDNWRELTTDDWVNFYKWLIMYFEIAIENAELNLDEISSSPSWKGLTRQDVFKIYEEKHKVTSSYEKAFPLLKEEITSLNDDNSKDALKYVAENIGLASLDHSEYQSFHQAYRRDKNRKKEIEETL
ncbi:MAG TPA: hypothetical protein DD671_10615 [Balneolaceae bacterium]|nr:hypothetical protein [Balneolaceae bacterium]